MQSPSLSAGSLAAPKVTRITRVVVQVVFFALIAAACALRLLWIGDVPFIADEPLLFSNALKANAQGGWVSLGLEGSKGVHYGPLPIWIYQVAVRVFHSPIEIAFLKSLIITLLTVGCLFVWTRFFRAQDKWFAWIALLSPCLWHYARDLWDNSWSVPFALMAWTSYLYFDQRPSLRRLFLPVIASACALLIHLMAVPIVGAIAMHFFVKHRLWILRRWLGVLGILGIGLLIDFSYGLQLVSTSVPGSPSAWSASSFIFPLRAARYFSGVDSNYFLGMNWMDVPFFAPWFALLVRAAISVSALSVIWFFWGIGVAILRQSRRGGWASEFASSWAGTSEQISLLTLLIFYILCITRGLSDHPHYFSAIWPAIFFLIWRGSAFFWNPTVPALSRIRFPARVVIGSWIVSLFVVTLAMQLRIHGGVGTRSLHYGPTLSNLWDVAEILSEKQGDRIIAGAFHPRLFPETLQSLVQWRLASKPPSPPPEVSLERWMVSYRYPKQTWQGELEVIPLPTAISP